MKFILMIFTVYLALTPFVLKAEKPITRDISHLITQEEFSTYQDVSDFIEQSPKVSITVFPSEADKAKYGEQVAKSLTGSDCDRDGKMDDNKTCNAVFYKLWLKYAL